MSRLVTLTDRQPDRMIKGINGQAVHCEADRLIPPPPKPFFAKEQTEHQRHC